ncbi:MAG: Arc family DNA-binding protein [Paracoccus sp. (in: a-proteobacteria)]
MSERDSEPLTRDLAPFGLRMQPDLKDRIKATAEANNRSMNAEIVATLEEKYPKPKHETPWAREVRDQINSAETDEQAQEIVDQFNRKLDEIGYGLRLELTGLRNPDGTREVDIWFVGDGAGSGAGAGDADGNGDG